jgi:DNA replication and repair protein RecF
LYITHLRIENVRNLEAVEIEPVPGLNYFYGENGAGKTSLLEALFLLSRGKSFRTTSSDELIRHQAETFQVFLEARNGDDKLRLGLERSKKNWRARKDGQDVALLSELSRALPIVLMEPNSHTLVSGSPDGRRRFLDWGVFHVEPLFLDTWRQYSRGLKQRNAALRRGQAGVIDSLDDIIAPLGEQLSAYRQRYFEDLSEEFNRQLDSDRNGLQGIGLRFHKGWKMDSLAEALQAGRDRDVEQGLSLYGPHRADVLLEREGRPVKSILSRGEQKNVAACLLLSQAELLKQSARSPIILLDDLASEFDQRHFKEVLRKALSCASQVWVTGVLADGLEGSPAVFHVEHGKVLKVV